MSERQIYRRRGKRVMDLMVAVPLGLLLIPISLVVGTLIKLEDGGPIIFSQERVGRDGKAFTLRKFRSMPVGSPNIPSVQASALATTAIGKLLRRTSLDELPQIVSVLQGNMSIVGPRPAMPTQTVLLSLRAANGSIGLRPGLTGLAQVRSYDGMTDESKAFWDAEYLHHVQLKTDIVVLGGTVRYLTRQPPRY